MNENEKPYKKIKIEWTDENGQTRSIEDDTGNYPHRCVRVTSKSSPGKPGTNMAFCIVPNMDLNVRNEERGGSMEYLDIGIVDGESFRSKTSPQGSTYDWKRLSRMQIPTDDIAMVKFQKNLLDIGRPSDLQYRTDFPGEVEETYKPATVLQFEEAEIDRMRESDRSAFARGLSRMIQAYGNGDDGTFEDYKERLQRL